MLQRVTTCCNVLQRVTTGYKQLQDLEVVLQEFQVNLLVGFKIDSLEMCYNVLQRLTNGYKIWYICYKIFRCFSLSIENSFPRNVLKTVTTRYVNFEVKWQIYSLKVSYNRLRGYM